MFQVHQCPDVFTLDTHNWTVFLIVVVFQLDVCLYIQRNTKITVFCYTHNEQRTLNLRFSVAWQKNCIAYESKTFVYFWEIFSCLCFNGRKSHELFGMIFFWFNFIWTFRVFHFSNFSGFISSELFLFYFIRIIRIFSPNFSGFLFFRFCFIRILFYPKPTHNFIRNFWMSSWRPFRTL